jgi:hypothetical protein
LALLLDWIWLGGGLAAWGVGVKRGRCCGGVGQMQVDPDGVVVGGGGEGGGERVVGRGPEDAGGGDGQVGRGKDVGQAQTAEAVVERGVEGGVAAVGRFAAAVGAAGGRVLQGGMGEEGAQCLGATVAVLRVEIGLAHQDEGAFGRGKGQGAVQEVEPEGSLVMVAATVAVFGPVEGGGRGVPEKERQGPVADADGQGDVGVGRKALDVDETGVGVGRHEGAGKVAPEEIRVAGGFPQGQAGEDGKAARAWEAAPALRIGRFAGAAIGIGVEAGGNAGVGLDGVAVGIGVARMLKPVGEGCEGLTSGVVVDARQDQDIGVQRGDDGDGGVDLRVVACKDVLQQEAGSGAFEGSVPEGDAEVLRSRWGGGGKEEGGQAVA